MKKIKVLFAVIAVVAMLSTVAFAADSAVSFGADTVAYTDGEELVINIYSESDIEIGKNRYIFMTYDNDVWEYVSDSSDITTLYTTDYPKYGEFEIVLSSQDSVALTAEQKIVEIKFTKKDGAEAVGSKFVFEDDGYYRLPAGTKVAYSGEIEVVAASVGPKYSYEAAAVTKEVKVAKDGEFVDTFNDAVIATASVPADTTAEDYGIIFLNDGNYAKVEGELAHISMKSVAVDGDGTFEFGVVMHGIPAEVIEKITAQYYIYE